MLVRIESCGECTLVGHTKGVCRHYRAYVDPALWGSSRKLDGYEPIPSWCPLRSCEVGLKGTKLCPKCGDPWHYTDEEFSNIVGEQICPACEPEDTTVKEDK